MLNFKEMSNTEFKQYLFENRNNDDAFRAALSKLLNRNPDVKRYLANMPLEEIEQLIQKHIEKKNT